MKSKKPRERQYTVQATVKFVVCATSLKEAEKFIKTQLEGQNTIGEMEVTGVQMLLPQEDILLDEIC